MSLDPQPAVRFASVSFRHGRLPAVRDVTLTIKAGTSVAFLGPNGSGKSTMLDLMAGLKTPTAGALEVAAPRHRIAYVLQRLEARQALPVTVDEVLRMGRYGHRGLTGRLTADDREAIDRAADRTEIDDLRRRRFHELSGGQRQRVLLAQALAAQPDLLLLDEPITGLDLASQERILAIVAEETSRGTTVVLTTHHLDEARHCDVAVLLASEIIASGPPDETLTADNLRLAYAERLLGDHHAHDHAHEMVILDDHGHGHAD
jgi:ABC-type Mn2+/Zn2+ transport system ATPase subunit